MDIWLVYNLPKSKFKRGKCAHTESHSISQVLFFTGYSRPTENTSLPNCYLPQVKLSPECQFTCMCFKMF